MYITWCHRIYLFVGNLLKPQRLRLRRVLSSLLNLSQNLGRQLVDHGERLDVLKHLLGSRRACDERRDVGVLERPCERKLGERDTQLLGNRLEARDNGQVRLPRVVAKGLCKVCNENTAPITLSQPRARRRCGHVIVFARQDTLLQRRKHRQAQPMLSVQPAVLRLDTLARQQVVLRLLDDRADKTQLIGDAPGRCDLAGGPFGGTPVERLALVDNVVEGADDLFNRCVSVRAVCVDDVDVWQVQALQREI